MLRLCKHDMLHLFKYDMLHLQVILCTKANNVKAKASAFNLLEEIGNSLIFADSRAKEGMKNTSSNFAFDWN